MQNNEEKAIAPIVITFEGVKLTCPIEEGHRMVPVKRICEIIDVDFQTQDNWLKAHPMYAQLYRLAYTTGADNKIYEMSCLSIFDVDGWVNSIAANNRRPGSVDKQYAFLVWLREKKLDMYKSIEVLLQENEEEVDLLTQIEAKEKSIADKELELKTERKAVKELQGELKKVRSKKYKGSSNPNQTEMAFSQS
jgi:hypothetical protein